MEQIVWNHFTKLRRNSHKIEEITANVKAVSCDLLKPAFLYDISGCDRKTLVSFTHDINLANFGSTLSLLCINECHLFITQIDLAKNVIENALNDGVFFIDIGQDKPKVLKHISDDLNLKQMLNIVLEKLQSSEESVDVIEINLEPNWNGCSLFGVLLGFPCVYTYDTNNGENNCLSYLDLVQIQGF